MKKIKILIGRFCKIFAFSFVIWFILNPSFERHNIYFAIIVGFLSSFFFITIARTFVSQNIFDFFFKKDFYKYIFFMLKEIVLSSYFVIKSIFFIHKYQCSVVIIDVPEKISMGKLLLLSSSITLTPGTSVILIEDKKMHIHCLLETNMSIQNGDFINKVLSFKF